MKRIQVLFIDGVSLAGIAAVRLGLLQPIHRPLAQPGSSITMNFKMSAIETLSTRNSYQQAKTLAAITVVLVVGAMVFWLSRFSDRKRVKDFASLMAQPIQALEAIDVGQVNLLCAEGLPGTEDMDVNVSLARLDEAADRRHTVPIPTSRFPRQR